MPGDGRPITEDSISGCSMSDVRARFGIDDSTFDWMNEMGDGRCWICRSKASDVRNLSVDHCHETGAVRGLLCTSCNRRLGATNNPRWLLRAAAYLLIASNAFGDSCHKCGKSSKKRMIRTDGECSTFEHSCCGEKWTVSYRTAGIPTVWELGACPGPISKNEVSARLVEDIEIRAQNILFAWLSREER